MTSKKKIARARVQFTFKSKLYKVGDEIKCNKKVRDALIDKNLIKWQ